MRKIQFADLLNESVNVSKIEAVERTWRDGNINRYPDGRGKISYLILCGGENAFRNVRIGRSVNFQLPPRC